MSLMYTSYYITHATGIIVWTIQHREMRECLKHINLSMPMKFQFPTWMPTIATPLQPAGARNSS